MIRPTVSLKTLLLLPSFFLWIGSALAPFAMAATLENFEINTDKNAVKVILHADQRVHYSTENDGRHFSIILPNTQLAAEQIKNGLPVVIDNRNKFIGRAIPMEGGNVKITFPNLTPNRYAISIVQKTGAVAPSTRTVFLPGRALLNEGDNTFEAIARSFEGKASKPAIAGYSVDIPRTHLSSAKPNAQPSRKSKYPHRQVVAKSLPVPKGVTPVVVIGPKLAAPSTPGTKAESISTVALAENQLKPTATHLVPPVSTLQTYHTTAAKHLSTFKPFVSPSAEPDFFSGIKDQALHFPTWALVGLAMFSGGLGLAGLLGFFLFLKRAFSPKQNPKTPVILHPEAPAMALADLEATAEASLFPAGSEASWVEFHDTAHINAAHYLRHTPGNIEEAVQNAVMLRLPHTLRKRDPKRKEVSLGKRGATFPHQPGKVSSLSLKVKD